MNRLPSFWIDGRIDRLREMYKEDKSVSQIADELGCTVSAVYHQVHRLKLTRSADRILRDPLFAHVLCGLCANPGFVKNSVPFLVDRAIKITRQALRQK